MGAAVNPSDPLASQVTSIPGPVPEYWRTVWVAPVAGPVHTMPRVQDRAWDRVAGKRMVWPCHRETASGVASGFQIFGRPMASAERRIDPSRLYSVPGQVVNPVSRCPAITGRLTTCPFLNFWAG